ncbi:MAG TPA: RHS repeat-associated core domain-containing protein [Luteimonas sp.]|nr:RHS repeat-associated core domain-containing protein [Luteimonas sp.]
MTIAARFIPLHIWSAAFGLMLSLSAAQAQTVIYYHTDALGSPVATTDATGAVIERTEYEPYGQVLGEPVKDGPGYTGHVSDAQTGLSYMQQRYYDPMIGRFLSVDPVTASSSTGSNFNRYWYANNNPYRFTDPDGRRCKTADKKAECTYDEFKDEKGNDTSRAEALASGSKLAKFFNVDRGSRILRAEAGMTAKYVAAKALAAKGGQVLIKGNQQLGIPDQTVTGAAIVARMESMIAIATPQEKGSTVAFVPPGKDGAPSDGPITFYRDGASARNVGRTFGHEILHTIYSGADLPNHGWANPAFNLQHQTPFNDASDEIK